MPIPPLTTCLVVASLSLEGLALMLYLYDRPHPQLRVVATVMFVIGTVFLAMALRWRWEDRRRRRRAKDRFRRRLRDFG